MLSQTFESKKARILILIFLVLLTISLRLYNWDKKFSFNAEYNYKLWPIQKILVNKDMTLIGIEAVSYIHHIHYPPFFLYLFAPVLYIGNYNPASIEMALIFLSGLTAIVFYMLGKAIKDDTFGFLLSFIYSLSFLAQRSDRFIWVVGPILLLTAFFLLVLLRGLKKKKLILSHSFLLGATISLGLNFHYQMGALLIALALLLPSRDFRKKLTLQSMGSFVAGILLFTFPLIIFDLRNNFYNLQGAKLLFSFSTYTASLNWRITSTFAGIANIFLSLFAANDDPTRVVTTARLITIPTVLLMLFFLFVFYKASVKSYTRLWFFYLFSLIAASSAMFALFKNNFNYYLFILEPIAFLIIALLFVKGFQKRSLRIFTMLLFLLFISFNLYKDFTFHTETNWKVQQEAINHVFSKTTRSSPSIYFASFPSEEYAFLLYYAARKRNIDFESIELYEPWQVENNAEFVINPKDKIIGERQVFGELVIVQRKQI